MEGVIDCAGVAQTAEQLSCKEHVGGSMPPTSSKQCGDSSKVERPAVTRKARVQLPTPPQTGEFNAN